jgi:hypothetical protein
MDFLLKDKSDEVEIAPGFSTSLPGGYHPWN